MSRTRRSQWALVGLVAASVVLAGCGRSGPAEEETSASDEPVELSFLVDNTELTVALAEGLAQDFTASNPNIIINVETRPQGGEGDNVVKTRLATGDMTDLFMYNSGSLLQALNPAETLHAFEGADWIANLSEVFVPAVSEGDSVYGVPFGTGMGGGVLYNKVIYAELGLQIPVTWDEFMANNQVIKDAGLTPVIQTYQETWTSQLFILGDFHNVAAAEPTFAEDYTANAAKYATSEAAIRGFQHLQEVHDAGYLNEDFASATYADGLAKLATGAGAHYPMLTFAIPEIATQFPDNIEDVGFFALPGDDAATNGLTLWASAGIYVPNTVEGAKLEAAEKFLAFVASVEGCESQSRAATPSGPYLVQGCTLPEDVPSAVLDLLPYVDGGSETSSLALEFLSPLKGPALEQITVEVGSGIRTAEDGAALYDEDVKKQAEQLGLEGW